MSAESSATPPIGSTIREGLIAVAVACAVGLLVLLIGGGDDGTAEGGETAAAPPAPTRDADPPGNYSASDAYYRYVVDLPTGEAWSAPAESLKRSYDLLRTTVRSESGAVLVIDRTPADIPALGGEFESTRPLPHPRFGEMMEYVFADSTIAPACYDATCVDYLVEDGRGGGWGVLAGGTDLPEAKALARRTAESLRLGD